MEKEIEKLKYKIKELEKQIEELNKSREILLRDLYKAKTIQNNFLPLPIDTFPQRLLWRLYRRRIRLRRFSVYAYHFFEGKL